MSDAPRRPDEAVYVVTDIECDGPWPGPNSMIAFASVAVTASGARLGSFEAVLEGLPGAAADAGTLDWFQTQPQAWRAATTDPKPPTEVMSSFVDWLQGLDRVRVFAAMPLAFDGLWIDYYLRRFTSYGLVQGPYEQDRLFHGAGLCLRSFAAGVTGLALDDCTPSGLPAEWFGHIEHTHKAMDDALGYSYLLVELMGRSAERR